MKKYTEEDAKRILGSNYKAPVRDFAVIGVLGEQGAGKSDLFRLLALSLYEGNKDLKILILDPAGARGFEGFETMTFEQYKSNVSLPINHSKRWKKGIKKMPVTIENTDEALNLIAEKFKNGIIFLDEGNQLITRAGTTSAWQSKMFRQCRNRCVDVYFAAHSFEDVKYALRGHFKVLYLFRTPDQFDSPKFFRDLGYQGDHQELYELALAAQKRTYKAISIQQVPKVWYCQQFKEQLTAVKQFKKG